MDVSASFQFVADALRGDWDVYAPDWRGFGLTDRGRLAIADDEQPGGGGSQGPPGLGDRLERQPSQATSPALE